MHVSSFTLMGWLLDMFPASPVLDHQHLECGQEGLQVRFLPEDTEEEPLVFSHPAEPLAVCD